MVGAPSGGFESWSLGSPRARPASECKEAAFRLQDGGTTHPTGFLQGGYHWFGRFLGGAPSAGVLILLSARKLQVQENSETNPKARKRIGAPSRGGGVPLVWG